MCLCCCTNNSLQQVRTHVWHPAVVAQGPLLGWMGCCGSWRQCHDPKSISKLSAFNSIPRSGQEDHVTGSCCCEQWEGRQQSLSRTFQLGCTRWSRGLPPLPGASQSFSKSTNPREEKATNTPGCDISAALRTLLQAEAGAEALCTAGWVDLPHVAGLGAMGCNYGSIIIPHYLRRWGCTTAPCSDGARQTS